MLMCSVGGAGDSLLLNGFRCMGDVLRRTKDALAYLGLDIGTGIHHPCAPAYVLRQYGGRIEETRQGKRQCDNNNARMKRLGDHLSTPGIKQLRTTPAIRSGKVYCERRLWTSIASRGFGWSYPAVAGREC